MLFRSRQGRYVARIAIARSPKLRRVTVATLRATGHVLISLLLALLTVVLMEWLARGSLAGVPDFLLSTSRPGMVAVTMIFLLFIAFDALIGRAHQSWLILMPLALLLAFLSMQKQQYLSDPLYPSDMLFGRQIGQLAPVIFASRPFAVISLLAAVLAFCGVVFYLLLPGRRHFPALSPIAKLLRLAVALPLIGGFLPLIQPNS